MTRTQPVARVERVLDAAADLLVKWGYQRVTIEEVARHAGIGKGTVYLHFRTKDALFLTAMLRAHRRVVGGMVERIEADPAEALPSRLVKAVYLDLAGDPVGRVLYLGDAEVLGRLAHEAAATMGELAKRGWQVQRRHVELLREAGCLRPDLDIDAQMYVLKAIGAGFFFVDSQLAEPSDPRVRAELLAGALADALEVSPTGAIDRVAPAVAEQYRALLGHINEEWQRRVR